ncbi:MAG: FliM/FliN family flagellar motor switch protein [Candidatus Aminicenantes bacterium]|nr:MAG: FliM/FliN family flagellar motor switch protein [Candidatus Aminicenantes bacterium]
MKPDKIGISETSNLEDYQKSFDQAIKELEDFVEIPIRVNVLMGKKKVILGELLGLEPGSLLVLNQRVGESLSIYLEDTFFAKGEVAIPDDTFAVRITEINDPRKV